MPNSNGRIYVDNTTDPPKGVSIADVQTVLGTTVNTLDGLCTHENINMWSKCKPIHAQNKENPISPIDYESSEQITNYHCGLSVVMADNEIDFINAVKAAFISSDYQDKDGNCVMVKYDRPQGGIGSPYRLSDFNGYNHNSGLDTYSNEENAGTGEHWIQSMYGKNIPINLLETSLSDVALPDDSARLSYFENRIWPSVNDRQSLHILDLVKWPSFNSSPYSLNLSSFKRGIMLWNEDVTYVFVETIPFGSNASLSQELGSSGGKDVNVVEFYYNNSGNGLKYICIPTFSYTTKCYTRFSFIARPIGGNKLGYISLQILSFDGNLDNFHNLWLGIEVKVPNSNVWERQSISTGDVNNITYNGYITIRYYGETRTTSVGNPGNIVGTYEYNLDGIEENGIEGVLKEDAYPSGTLVRAILYGNLTNSTSSWEKFYESENPEDWYTIE